MKVEIKKCFKEFKSIWEKTISKMCVENTMEFSKEGLEIKFTSPSNVAMGRFRVTADEFDTYDITGELEKLNVKTEAFVKYTKTFKKDIILSMENERLVLSSNKSKIEMGVLSDVDDKPFKDPNTFETSGHCTVKTADLLEAIKNTKLIGETPTLILNSDTFKIAAEGHIDSASMELETINKEVSEEIKVKINATFLEQVTNPVFDTVTLKMSTDGPLIFICKKDNIVFDGAIAPNIG